MNRGVRMTPSGRLSDVTPSDCRPVRTTRWLRARRTSTLRDRLPRVEPHHPGRDDAPIDRTTANRSGHIFSFLAKYQNTRHQTLRGAPQINWLAALQHPSPENCSGGRLETRIFRGTDIYFRTLNRHESPKRDDLAVSPLTLTSPTLEQGSQPAPALHPPPSSQPVQPHPPRCARPGHPHPARRPWRTVRRVRVAVVRGDAPKSGASLLEGCANCRLVNSGNRQW